MPPHPLHALFSSHRPPPLSSLFFFFNDTATTEIYTLSLHDALPILSRCTPLLRLITSTPWSAAYTIPVKSRPAEVRNVESTTFTARSVTYRLTPASTVALLATTDATAVPCQKRSLNGSRPA